MESHLLHAPIVAIILQEFVPKEELRSTEQNNLPMSQYIYQLTPELKRHMLRYLAW